MKFYLLLKFFNSDITSIEFTSDDTDISRQYVREETLQEEQAIFMKLKEILEQIKAEV